MAMHLLDVGYSVIVYNRTKDKAEELLARGASWASTPKEVANQANIIITMVGYPKDVEEIYLGSQGIIENGSGLYVIDMTTTSIPTLAVKIYEEAKRRGMFALDAPVSGGDVGAKEARLLVMVGGDEKVFNEIQPLFNVLGTNVVYQGEAGAGQHTKKCVIRLRLPLI